MKNLKKISRNELKKFVGGKMQEESCTRCTKCANGMNSCATDAVGNCNCAEQLAAAMC